jgi:hypothetical protein
MDAGNYIALVGLLLGLGSLTWQIVGYLRGPLPKSMAPESITLRGDHKRSDTDRNALSITASTINFINEAGKDHDAIVRSIDVTMNIPNKARYLLSWLYFMKDSTANEKEQAGPFVVSGGSGVSKEVRFYARLNPCKTFETCTNDEAYANYLSWADFASWAADPKILPFVDLTFQSTYLVPSNLRETHTCRITFPDAVRARFAKEGEKVPYMSLPCVLTSK